MGAYSFTTRPPPEVFTWLLAGAPLTWIDAPPETCFDLARSVEAHVASTAKTGERAVVTIEPIHADRKARVAELARMLGDRNAKSALAHAEKLLRAG